VVNTYGERGDFNSLLPLRATDANAYGVNAANASSEVNQLFKIDTIWSEITADYNTIGYSPMLIHKATTWQLYLELPIILSTFTTSKQTPAIEIYQGTTSMPDALKYYMNFGFVLVDFIPSTRWIPTAVPRRNSKYCWHGFRGQRRNRRPSLIWDKKSTPTDGCVRMCGQWGPLVKWADDKPV
jgi:hypothetical protein